MRNKTNRHTKINTITQISDLTSDGQGFWLYDSNRGMNLAMRAVDEREALIYALEYYQDKLVEVEEKYDEMKKNVSIFLDNIGIDILELAQQASHWTMQDDTNLD